MEDTSNLLRVQGVNMFKSDEQVATFINKLETYIDNIIYVKMFASQGLDEAAKATIPMLNKRREELEEFIKVVSGITAVSDLADTFPCPECGGEMLLRTNRQNGDKFWGCKKYPECRGTRDSSGLSKEERRAQQDSYTQQSGFSFKRSPATEVGPNKE